MKFNVLKCVVMTTSNKRPPLILSYTLDQDILSRQDTIKYLGVTIDNKLSFKQHILDKTKKATTVLNLIRRNLHFAPRSVKCKAYMSCVRPIIEYASSCWSPTSSKLSNRIEMVQHNAAKFITNQYPRKGHYGDFSITKIIEDLQLETLEARRNNAKLTMAYKIINDHVILPPDLLPRQSHNRPIRSCTEVRVGTKHQLYEPIATLHNPEATFFYSVPKLWNSLITPEQAACRSVKAFQSCFQR